ncbi:unnamed protein product [Meganyctiphanes norvegica]|uniref:Uncharacterized protein n=1 Tax=Meganyctiphanes norvegica TaxID=48144 RepID=A0AAV2PVJ6_MEGNR
MPANIPLDTLCNCAFKQVWQWLYNLINRHPGFRNTQRYYLIENLLMKFRDQLLRFTFKEKAEEVSTLDKCSFIKLLADDKTKVLDFTNSAKWLFEDVMSLYYALEFANVVNLYRFGVRCSVTLTESEFAQSINVNASFYDTLRSMVQLTSLTLTGIANGTILKILARNCEQLKYLNVQDSKSICDNCVVKLILTESIDIDMYSVDDLLNMKVASTPCTSKLTHVGLSGTSVTLKSAVILLQYIPNLLSFEGQVNEGSTFEAISIMAKNCSYDESFVLKLTHLCDSQLPPEKASLISRVCPDLMYVDISASWINSLYNLQTISHLSLDVDFGHYINDIYNYLYGYGEYLTTLNLKKSNSSPLDLEWLINFTPNLEHLNAYLECSNTDLNAYWVKLKTASIVIKSAECFIVFCKFAPLIEELDLKFKTKVSYDDDDWHSINDTLVVSVLVDGGLLKLKKLIIGECDLGIDSVEYIMSHCYNLAYIGNLGW